MQTVTNQKDRKATKLCSGKSQVCSLLYRPQKAWIITGCEASGYIRLVVAHLFGSPILIYSSPSVDKPKPKKRDLRMGFLESLFGPVFEPVSNLASSGAGFASCFGFVFQPPSQPGYTLKQLPSGKLALGPGKS